MSQDIIQLPHQHLAHLEDEDLKHAIERNFREIAHMLYNLQLYEKKTGKPINSKVDGVIDENGKLITGMLSEKMVGLQNELQLAAEAVTEAKLAVAAVVAEKIAEQAVEEAKIAVAAITKNKIADGAVDEAKIADAAITAVKLAREAVTGEKLGPGAVDLSKFADGLRPVQTVDVLPSLPDEEYPQNAVVCLSTDNKLYRSTGTEWTAAVPTSDLDGQITETQIADDAITTPKIAAGAIDADKIAANAVTADKILAGAVEAGKIAAEAITADKLAANAVTADKIAANAVEADKIKAGAIGAEAIAAGAIVTDKLDALAVTAAKIAAGAIIAEKIATGAIDADKIAANAVTGVKILAGEIATEHLAAKAVTAEKMNVSELSAISSNIGTILAGSIAAGVVQIGPDTTFAEGYDPADNHLYFQYSADGETSWHDTFNPATDKYMRQKVGDDGTWSAAARIVGQDGQDGHTPVKGTDYFDGVDGLDGTNSYLWVRYSQNANGNPMTTDPTGAKYIGIATTTTASAPTDYTDYSWSLIKGSDGIPGEPGADGRTSYLHIKYSDDGETFTPTREWETEIENVAYKYVQYINANNWVAQSFNATENLIGATKVKAALRSNMTVGTPPDTFWHIHKDNGTETPGASISSKGFGKIAGEEWASNFNWSEIEIELDEPLQEGQKYWLVVSAETGDDSNTVKGMYQDGNVFPGHGVMISGNKGNSWISYPTTRTLTFRIKGYNITSYEGETPGTYIGTYVDFNPVDSTDFNAYTWNKVKGEDGQDVRKFTSQPVPPYDVGDLWIGGSDGKNTLICVTARESGDFVASDWKPMTAPDVLKVDNRCKALFHFDGSINDHRGIMPTFTRASKAYLSDGTEVDAGVPRFEAGQFGQAVLVEEGTTNLFINPDFDTNSDWESATWHASGGIQGGAYYEYGYGWNFSQTVTINKGVEYTVSIFIRRNPTGNGKGRMYLTLTGEVFESNNHSTLNEYYTAPDDGKWHRMSVTFKVVGTGTTSLLVRFLQDGGTGTTDFDRAQLEAKPYPTSFTPGTRSPETLTIPTAGVLNPQEGAVVCRVYVNDASKYQNRSSTIFMADAGGLGKGIWLYHSNNSAYWRYQIRDENDNSKAITVADSETPNGWHFFAIKWKSTEAKLFVDGVLKGTMENPYLPSAIQKIDIGCWEAGNQLNSLIDDLAIFDYAPTDEEIQAWYEAGAPFYALDLPKPELPGYVKIESDGLRVYDIIGQLRGVFGSWLKDSERKYGIKIIAQDGRTIIIDEMGIMAPIWSNAESVMLGNQMQYQSHPVKFYIPAPKANIAKLRLSLDIKPTWIDNVFMYHYDKSNVYLQEFLGSYILVDPGHGHDIYHNFEYCYPVLALNVNIFIDGVNRTGELGGPWQLYDTPADLDILPYIDDREGWHTLQFKAQDGATVDSFVTGLVFMGVIEDEGALMLSEGEDLLSSNWEDEFNEFI